MKLVLLGKTYPQILFCFSLLPLIDMADISRFLGQATEMIHEMVHSSHLLAAFRSDESPSKLPCLVVITPHKALWSIKFSSPKWTSRYIHRESRPLTPWNWSVPFSSTPNNHQVTQRPKKHQQKWPQINTSVTTAAKFSKWEGGTSMLWGMCNFQFCLCLPYSQGADPRNKCNSYVYTKSWL